jgi:hypothetical protein
VEDNKISVVDCREPHADAGLLVVDKDRQLQYEPADREAEREVRPDHLEVRRRSDFQAGDRDEDRGSRQRKCLTDRRYPEIEQKD